MWARAHSNYIMQTNFRYEILSYLEKVWLIWRTALLFLGKVSSFFFKNKTDGFEVFTWMVVLIWSTISLKFYGMKCPICRLPCTQHAKNYVTISCDPNIWISLVLQYIVFHMTLQLQYHYTAVRIHPVFIPSGRGT